MDSFDGAAPPGAAASDAASSDDEVLEGELVDEGEVVDPGGGTTPAGDPADATDPGHAGDPGDPGHAGHAGDAELERAAVAAAAGEKDAASAAGIPELTAIERVTAERDEYLDALRRLQADSENLRKRIRRQEEERSARALESLVERLLPVLDATDLAAEHAGDEKDATAFAQVASLLWDVLAREGLERVCAEGVPFDPNVHDGVAYVPAEDAEPAGKKGKVPASPDSEDAGVADASADASADADAERATDAAGETPGVPMVDAILRPGFLLRGKVLRPAMVRVRG